jgi:hypothetical protein
MGLVVTITEALKSVTSSAELKFLVLGFLLAAALSLTLSLEGKDFLLDFLFLWRRRHSQGPPSQGCPHIYVGELIHDTMGFAAVTTKSLLRHVIDMWKNHTKKHLIANLESMIRPWDPDQPIEELLNHYNRCRSIAREGKDPISNESYARILVEIFNQRGVLERAVEEWEMNEEEDQTLVNTITHFTNANKHRLQKQTSLKSSLCANNAATAQPGQATNPGTPKRSRRR